MEWIPIEQGLPQKEGAYLLTIKYRYAGLIEDDVVIDRWTFKDKQMSLTNDNKGEFKVAKYADVLAWMPLPERYEPCKR